MKIAKKVWPEYFQAIVDGSKTYEVRLANFECKPGDILILKEWDPTTQKHTGRILEKKISYISKTKNFTFWNREDIEQYGYQIIAFT